MLCVVTLSVGCAGVSSNYCDIAKPIWWDGVNDLDATPTSVVRQIVSHNEVWERLCK